MLQRLLLVFSLLLASSFGFAQDRQVSGKVMDGTFNEALVGVSVIIKGTTQGSITDIDGNFTLNVPSDDAVLVFSYVGYTSEEIVVGTQSYIDLTMYEDITSLTEVVVIGYGTQKKSVVTGAIAKVDAEELTKLAVPRVDQAMQGQVAGVQISQSSGQPGSAPTVVIRGVGTNGNFGPLWIVDGMPGVDVSAINPADIESVEVLKDAASAAIYGSRGANGVIIVTTKKGKEGKTNLSYDGYYGVQNPWRKPNLLNSAQYVELMHEKDANTGSATSPFLPEIGEVTPNTDWIDEIFEPNAPIQDHNITISTGSEKGSFRLSTGYFDQQGIIGGDKSRFTRYTTRINATAKIAEFMTFGSNLTYIHAERRRLGENDIFGTPLADAYNLDPLFNIRNDTLDRGWGQSRLVQNELINPFSRIDVTESRTQTDNIYGNLNLDFRIIEGLHFKTDLGVNVVQSTDDNFTPTYSFTNNVFNNVNSVGKGQYQYFQWQWENTLIYSKQINQHSFSVLLGTTALRENSEWFGVSVRNIPPEQESNPNWWYIDAGADSTIDGYGNAAVEHSLSSLFGRITYDFDEKYLLTLIVRRDGSSNFGPDNKYATFPSASVGWVISRENFWNVSWFDFLKLRIGYGENGNESIPALQYTPIISRDLRTYEFGKPTNELQYNGASPAVLPNPSVQWEESRMLDIGADFGFFNSKVTMGLDYFNKETAGLLMFPIVEVTRGNDPASANVGTMRNRGFEVELGYQDRFGDVGFNVTFNATYLQNKVTEVSGEDGFLQGFFWPTKNVEITRMQEGLPIGYFLGYQTAGIFQSQDEVDFEWVSRNPDNLGEPLQPTAKPGDFRIVDTNGDGLIDDADKTQIGKPWPDWMLGGTIGADWKGFDISLLFTASLGNDIYKIYKRQDLSYANLDDYWLQRWTPENPSNEIPRIVSSYRESDFFVEDGSFLRIRNLTLGYTLPGDLTRKAKIEKLRFYFTVDNLATLTGYTGFDPEIGTPGWILQTGIDQGFYPQARTTRLGVNLTF